MNLMQLQSGGGGGSGWVVALGSGVVAEVVAIVVAEWGHKTYNGASGCFFLSNFKFGEKYCYLKF